MWLSTRSLTIAHQKFPNKTVEDYYLSNFKYYTEFKVNNHEIIEKAMPSFAKHGIKLDLLIDDVRSYLASKEEVTSNERKKRSTSKNPRLLTAKVVGRYASHLDVLY